MKKSHMEAKLTKSFENFSKLKGKTQNFEKKLNNSSKKLMVSAAPLCLLARTVGCWQLAAVVAAAGQYCSAAQSDELEGG